MFTVHLNKLFGRGPVVAAGATLGTDHFKRIIQSLPSTSGEIEVPIAIDCRGIEDATPSYVKATILALHQCGRRHVRALLADEQQELEVPIVPLNIVTMITHGSDAVRDCVHEVFSRRGLAILAGKEIDGEQLKVADLLGELEPMVFEALTAACMFDEFQAGDLKESVTSSKISVTGWNNRLAELYRQRLVRRRTDGRTHRFIPLTRKVEPYGQVLLRR